MESLWQYSVVHTSACKVIEEQTLWGQTVRGLAMHLPQATSGQPLPCVAMNDLPANITGFRGLFEIRLQAGMHQQTSSVQQTHVDAVIREEERGMIAFAARRKAIERSGLPEVRQYRLARCDAEELQWRRELQTIRQIVPEIRPLLALRVRSAECEVRS